MVLAKAKLKITVYCLLSSCWSGKCRLLKTRSRLLTASGFILNNYGWGADPQWLRLCWNAIIYQFQCLLRICTTLGNSHFFITLSLSILTTQKHKPWKHEDLLIHSMFQILLCILAQALEPPFFLLEKMGKFSPHAVERVDLQ